MPDATASSAPADRLGPTTAPFRRLLWDDLPEEWRTPVPAEALADCAAGMGGSLSAPRGVRGAAGLPVGLALQPLGTAASFPTLPHG